MPGREPKVLMESLGYLACLVSLVRVELLDSLESLVQWEQL